MTVADGFRIGVGIMLALILVPLALVAGLAALIAISYLAHDLPRAVLMALVVIGIVVSLGSMAVATVKAVRA